MLQQTKVITREHSIIKETAIFATINHRITTTTATKTTTIILATITTETTTIKIEIETETVTSTNKDDPLDRTKIDMNLETDILEDKVCKNQLKHKQKKSKMYFSRNWCLDNENVNIVSYWIDQCNFFFHFFRILIRSQKITNINDTNKVLFLLHFSLCLFNYAFSFEKQDQRS